jgi:ubiquinone/menaquinone biosynthesis C-methylase UbiE
MSHIPSHHQTMICDYEGSDYKADFWQNADRAYEDAVERVAVRRLLPPAGKRMAEFGAGFGRLADLYTGYDEIILLDYSRTMLEQAQQCWGNDPRFRFVAADIYHLPFADGIFSAATMIRVIHHIADVTTALGEIRRTVAPGGCFVMEFANKRNLKAVSRYALRRQTWSPFAPQPVEFVTLNYNFHPRWMAARLRQAGFATQRALAVSYLRSGALKRFLPIKWMVYLDALLQLTARLGALSPSIFTRNTSNGPRAVDGLGLSLSGDHLFRSPRSGATLRREGDALVCDVDGTRWHAQGNFYDFKEPL